MKKSKEGRYVLLTIFPKPSHKNYGSYAYYTQDITAFYSFKDYLMSSCCGDQVG